MCLYILGYAGVELVFLFPICGSQIVMQTPIGSGDPISIESNKIVLLDCTYIRCTVYCICPKKVLQIPIGIFVPNLWISNRYANPNW
jgi:hypothetical protein